MLLNNIISYHNNCFNREIICIPGLNHILYLIKWCTLIRKGSDNPLEGQSTVKITLLIHVLFIYLIPDLFIALPLDVAVIHSFDDADEAKDIGCGREEV